MASRSRWLQVAAAFLLGWLFLAPPVAEAGSRKRVVVLELEGPKAEKFHADLVKLIKKSHSVVPVDKWVGTAEEMGASKLTKANIKKVAKKLKVDVVVEGKVEKRRDEYILQLKVHAGASGDPVGSRVDVKSDEPKLSADAKNDLKDELIELINGVESNRAGGDEEGEEEEEKPAKKKDEPKTDEEEEEDKPKKKGFSKKSLEEEEETAEEEKPAKKVKKDEEEAALKTKKDEEEENPLPKKKKTDEEGEEEEDKPKKKKKKKVAAAEEEEAEEGVEEEGEVGGLEGEAALSPGERAIDAVLGLSFNMRRLSWSTRGDLGSKPPPYNGVPVAGAMIDATIYPLAIGHKSRGMAKNFGLTVMYDKVLRIQSKQGNPPTTLPTAQARYAFGAVFRYPLGEKLTVGGILRYGRQNFTINSAGGVTPNIPNVNYTIIDPMAFLRFQAMSKLVFNVNLGFMAMPETGQIQKSDQYGAATVTGFEGEIGGDYMLTGNIFVRAAFRFETIGFSFKGGDMTLANTRDNDGTTQDVFGARDTYLGGAVTAGYVY